MRRSRFAIFGRSHGGGGGSGGGSGNGIGGLAGTWVIYQLIHGMGLWLSVPVCTDGIISLEFITVPYSLHDLHLAKSSEHFPVALYVPRNEHLVTNLRDAL